MEYCDPGIVKCEQCEKQGTCEEWAKLAKRIQMLDEVQEWLLKRFWEMAETSEDKETRKWAMEHLSRMVNRTRCW